MKILLISPLPPPEGGIATWTKKYQKFCIEKNINLDIVNTALKGRRAMQINSGRSIKDEIKRTLFIIRALKKKLICFQPDIVHINSSCSKFGIFRDLLLVSIVQKNNSKVILHFRCNISDQVKSKLARKAFCYMVNNANLIIVLNSFSYNYVTYYTKQKPVIIPNFINEEQIDRKYKVRATLKEVVFVGHVQYSKGANELCMAAKEFKQLHFTIIGPLEEKSAILDWPDNVTLTGTQDALFVKKALHNADVFFFPTYTEGFSNAIAEAMATGLPIITTNVGANKEMIENKGGLIIKVANIDDIHWAFNKIQDYDLRKNMSYWNRNKVMHNYLIEPVMHNIFDKYKEVLEHG